VLSLAQAFRNVADTLNENLLAPGHQILDEKKQRSENQDSGVSGHDMEEALSVLAALFGATKKREGHQCTDCGNCKGNDDKGNKDHLN